MAEPPRHVRVQPPPAGGAPRSAAAGARGRGANRRRRVRRARARHWMPVSSPRRCSTARSSCSTRRHSACSSSGLEAGRDHDPAQPDGLREGGLPGGPDGFLAVVPVAGVPLDDLVLPPDPLVLVCEGSRSRGTSAPCSAPPMPPVWPRSSRRTRSPTGATPTSSGPARDGVLGAGRLGHDRGGARLAAAQRHPDRRHHPGRGAAHTQSTTGAPVAVAVGTEKARRSPTSRSARPRSRSASRWSAGSTPSTPRRRPPSSSTRRSRDRSDSEYCRAAPAGTTADPVRAVRAPLGHMRR